MTEAEERGKLRSNERVFICGKTGSGKTYLAHHLLKQIPRVVVIDSKGSLGSWNFLEWNRDTRRMLRQGEPARVRIAVDVRAHDLSEFWDDVFWQVYEIGDLTMYIDEVYGVVDPGSKPLPSMNAIWTRGREFGIGGWAATQRPTWCPLFILSEAEHFFMFRLTLHEDRRRMAAFMTEPVIEPIRDKHGFYYMQAEDDEPRYIKRLEI